MYFTPVWIGVLSLVFIVDAVPHRSFDPSKSRGIPVGVAWSEVQRPPGPRATPTERAKEVENHGDNIVAIKSSTERKPSRNRPLSNNRNRPQSVPQGMPQRLPQSVPQSVPQSGPQSVTQNVPENVPRMWRPKTVTKKLAAGQSRTVVKTYPSLLQSEQITNVLQQAKCHMPWINEVSKVQFYWDGINALCDLALTFEPCSTSGSVCRTHPVEFTCCPSTTLAVMTKCYKGKPPPENVCLPTTIKMSGMSTKPRSRSLHVSARRIEVMRPVKQQFMKAPVEGCTPECSPAWVDMFSNIQPVHNQSLPVCDYPDVLRPCRASGAPCARRMVDSICCPRKCIPELEKCYPHNPPQLVCTPRTLQPWISRIRKYF